MRICKTEEGVDALRPDCPFGDVSTRRDVEILSGFEINPWDEVMEFSVPFILVSDPQNFPGVPTLSGKHERLEVVHRDIQLFVRRLIITGERKYSRRIFPAPHVAVN